MQPPEIIVKLMPVLLETYCAHSNLINSRVTSHDTHHISTECKQIISTVNGPIDIAIF